MTRREFIAVLAGAAGINQPGRLWHDGDTTAISTERSLFDHLVGAGEQRRRDREAERPGGLEVDNKLELGRLLNW